MIVSILGTYRADPNESYFFGDFPQWGAWVVVLCWLVSFVLKRARQDGLSQIFFAASLWLPLVLINTDRPVVLILVTVLAVYFCKDSLSDSSEIESKNGAVEKEVDGSVYKTQTEYYDNEQKKEEANYKDGKIDGLRTLWYENGQKMQEENFNDDVPEGLWTYWYENGQLKEKANRYNGKFTSVEVWKPNGEKCPVTKIDKDGNGVIIIYNEDGTIKYQWNFRDGDLFEN